MRATGFFYLKLPAGYVQEWHPAPRRQYVIAISGRTEIELADGKKFHWNRADCSRLKTSPEEDTCLAA